MNASKNGPEGTVGFPAITMWTLPPAMMPAIASQNSGLDSGRLVGDDQDVLAVIALKVFGLVGRETDREIVVVAELEFGRSSVCG